MRFRMGFMSGFATGYYLGAMAGRERYEQINQKLRRVRRSDTFEMASEKAREAVDLGVERARDVVETKLGDGQTDSGPTATSPYRSP